MSSIATVEIRSFSGPDLVELDGVNRPAIIRLNVGPAGPAGPNSVTSTTTSDGTAELSLASLEAGSRDGLIFRNSDSEQLLVIGKDNSIDGESGSITGIQFGFQTVASGNYSFAIGAGATASGDYSYASGANTVASGAYSHAEGSGNTASGQNSHAEGDFTTASGVSSHAEGSNTTASGINSHAGGSNSTASGNVSYAQGTNAKAIHDGASVESDSESADVESTTTDEKSFRFANGYRFLGGSAYFEGTVLANHIHGNLAGSVYAHIRAGEALAKGDPVYVSGSHGTGANMIPIVSKADASNSAKMPAIGIMDADLANNASGHMVITGTIADLNTAAYAVNDTLYVASGGGFTATPPAANSQPVARVERSNANNGALIVKVNGLASNGGNGVSDANKLVRFSSTGTIPVASIGGLGTGVATALAINTGSAGAFVVNGGTAANMTFAGTASFTSTTRPTSAGTGTPAATSLITSSDSTNLFALTYITSAYRWSQAVGDYNTAHTGTGTASTATQVLQVNSGATSGSVAVLRGDVNDFRAWQKNSTTRQAPLWNLRTIHHVRLSIDSMSGADTVGRIYLGVAASASTATDLTSSNKAIGFKIVNGEIFVQLADGSTLTTATTGVTMSSYAIYDCVIDSKGDGTWDAYVNSTKISGTGAPSSVGSTGNAALIMSVTNGTTAATRRFFVQQQTTMQF